MTLEIITLLVLAIVQALKAVSERTPALPTLRDGRALAVTVVLGQALALGYYLLGWDITSLQEALGTGFGASSGAALIYKALALAVGRPATAEVRA